MKGKPRHNPEKYQNKIGAICKYSEDDGKGGIRCELGDDIEICKGNPHNCCKVKYHKLAILNK